MGKSPGKWIKSMLLGKKHSNRSPASKGPDDLKTGKDKENSTPKVSSPLPTTTPVISQHVLINSNINSEIFEGHTRAHATLGSEVVSLTKAHNTEKQENLEPHVPVDLEKVREQQVATRIQAVFRGYQSRKAFHARKGIIRLQAVVRGRLVRRQAAVTLRCLYGIVKLQAAVRGRSVRLSGFGLEVKAQLNQMKDMDNEQLSNWKAKLSITSFMCKLLAALPVKPLAIHYAEGEPNSVLCWLERWTKSHFWKPLPQPKKVVIPKSQVRRGKLTVESGLSKTKRNTNKNSLETSKSAPVKKLVENWLTPNQRISRSPAAISKQEIPHKNIDKVKSAAKMHATQKESSPKLKPTCILDNTTSCNVAAKEFSKKLEHVGVTVPEDEVAQETNALRPALNEANDKSPVESSMHNLENAYLGESTSAMVESITKDQHTRDENQSNIKRRASISSSSSQYGANSLLNPLKLPSYMQATESAKAKLRGQMSPGFGSDPVEKNNFARRHSLPSSLNSSMNGKLTSQSPRLQKLIQASGKSGTRNDRSLSMSRDGSEKSIQIAWRR